MRNIEGKQAVWGWSDKCRGKDSLFVNMEIGATRYRVTEMKVDLERGK